MDGRHAVGAVRAHDGEIGHPDLSLGTFLDEAHPLDTSKVAEEAGARLVAEATVDLEHDLELPRQEPLEPGERPLLQGLGQEGVVRVGEGAAGEAPGLVPWQVRLIEENAHQLGTARLGCVSLSWMATLWGSAPQSALFRRKRRTRSASEQATKKYSCTKRRPWPMLVESSG